MMFWGIKREQKGMYVMFVKPHVRFEMTASKF